jgi:hypothetical protein
MRRFLTHPVRINFVVEIRDAFEIEAVLGVSPIPLDPAMHR